MTESSAYLVTFEGVSAAEANRLAAELRDELRDKVAGVKADVGKDDQAAMDAGQIVWLVLSAQATVALAYGLANFLAASAPK